MTEQVGIESIGGPARRAAVHAAMHDVQPISFEGVKELGEESLRQYDIMVAARVCHKMPRAEAHPGESAGYVAVRTEVLNALVAEYDRVMGPMAGWQVLALICDRIMTGE